MASNSDAALNGNTACIFCNPDDAEGQRVVLENTHGRFIQQPQPVLIGSGIIVPKCHRETVFDLTEAEWTATFDLLQRAKQRLDAAHSPDGYTVGWNNGAVAGQSVFHVHLHVIPRFDDEPLAGKGIRHWIKQPTNQRAAITEQSEVTERFAVRRGGRITFVDTDAIRWVEAAGDYVRLHTSEKAHLMNATMRGMEERLDPDRFLRIHRSTIINTEHLNELRPYGNSEYIVVLDDGTELKLSRSYRSALADFFADAF
jgi:histidine triad (HIT) family protein